MHLFRASLLFCMVLISALTHGQSIGFGSNVLNNEADNTPVKTSFKPKVGVSLGTSFTAFSGANAISSWVMPQITMPVSDKWNVCFGMGYSTTFFSGYQSSGLTQNNNQYAHLFVSGQYLLNERVTLTGTAYKTLLLNPTPVGEQTNNYLQDFSGQGVMFDVNYKVTDHFQINVGVEYRQQNQPQYPGLQTGWSSGYGSMMPGSSYVPFP